MWIYRASKKSSTLQDVLTAVGEEKMILKRTEQNLLEQTRYKKQTEKERRKEMINPLTSCLGRTNAGSLDFVRRQPVSDQRRWPADEERS